MYSSAMSQSSERIEKIQKFMDYLECNGVIAARNFKIKDEALKEEWSKQLSMVLDLELTLEINHPDTAAGGVFFTINCNPGAYTEVGNKVSGLGGEAMYKKDPTVNALVVDIDDHSKNSSKAELWEYIKETCSGLSWRPLVTETNSGFHLIFPINPKDKKIMSQTYGLKERDSIYMALCHALDPRISEPDFDLIDKAHTKVYRRERCPYTFGEIPNADGTYEYCRLLAPEWNLSYEELEEFDWDKLAEYGITLINNRDTNILLNNYQTYFAQQKEINKVTSKFTTGHKNAFNECRIADIIARLSARWASQNLCKDITVLNGREIAYLVTLQNGYKEPHKTDGWKICNKHNYVNNFSPYDKVFRPVGGPYAFVYLMFGKSHSYASRFFYKEYGINLTDIIGAQDDDTSSLQRLTYQDITYTTTNFGTNITTIVNTKNGTAPKITKILNKPLVIICKGQTTRVVTPQGLIADSTVLHRWYVVHSEGKEFMITRQTNSQRFNDLYSCYGLHFLGDNNTIGTFFDMLEQADVPVVKIVTRSSLNPLFVALEGHFVRYHSDELNDQGTAPEGIYFAPNPEIELKDMLYTGLTGSARVYNCSLQEYFDGFNKSYKPLYSYIPFLVGILFGSIDYLDDTIKGEGGIKPGCMLSGERGTGKSQLAQIIRLMSGLNPQCSGTSGRFLDLQGTIQPVKQMLSDPALCTLDEPDEETKVDMIIKSAINMSTNKRGSLNGNLEFQFKSWILLTGNRKMADDSVNSRLFLLTFPTANAQDSLKAHYGNKDAHKWLMTHTPCFDIWKFWINHRDDVLGLREEKAKLIRGLINLEDRIIDSYARLLSIAQVLCDNNYIVDMDERDLLSHIKYHTKGSMQQINTNPMHSLIQLRCALMDLNNKRKLSLIYTPAMEGVIKNDMYQFIITDQRAYSTMGNIIMGYISAIHQNNLQMIDIIDMEDQQITVKVGADPIYDKILFSQLIGCFNRKKTRHLVEKDEEDIYIS